MPRARRAPTGGRLSLQHSQHRGSHSRRAPELLQRFCNLPRLLQFGAFEDADHVVLIIEYAAKGDLFDLLRHMGGRMKEADAVARIMTPFMKGLSYMHTLGVIHRDIKLENTLFSTDGTLKIADFGLSVDANHEAPVTRLGTLDYMSPGVTHGHFLPAAPLPSGSPPATQCRASAHLPLHHTNEQRRGAALHPRTRCSMSPCKLTA